MADSYVIVSGQNLLALQNKINDMLTQGYQPLSGTFAQVNNQFYQGMANLTGVPVSFGNVTGISDLFRQISTVNDKDALRMMVGSLFLGYNADNAKPGDWQPSVDQILNLGDIMRAFLKTTTREGMRSAMGAGTSNLIVGSGADEAKPGNWIPDVSEIGGASQVVEAFLESNNEEGARSAIGAGTSNLKVGTGATDAKAGSWLPKKTDIQELSATLVNLLSAVDQAAARAAIGAGTSSLSIGNGSNQAKAGDWKPTTSDVSDITNGAILAFLKYAGTDLTAAQQRAVRNIIGAGTSSLSLGSTATTAKAGNYAPAVDELTNATDLGKSVLKASTVAAILQIITGNTPQTNAFLRGDGTWQNPVGTTYSNATTTSAGLMSGSDKQKLDNIAAPLFTVVAPNGRPIDTAFMIDSARHADVTYSFAATLNATISASQNVQIECQVDGATVARLAIGITLTLAVTVGLTLPFTHSATFRVPAGKQVKFVKTGTAAVTVSVAAGQEVLL